MSEIKTNTVISPANEARLDILKDANGKLLLTEDQKKAVLEKGRILVSASAGAGKTSTMIKRIILMVCEGMSLKDMLILVYNESAASELKEKLHNALFEQACAATGELRERLHKEIDDIAFCHVSTIHSFCQSLIRENFDKLGISPTFKVLDENAHKTYINNALDEVFAQYAVENDSVFFDIAEQFSRARNDEEFKKLIERVYALIEIQPDINDFDDCVKQCYDSYEKSKFAQIYMDYYKKFAKKSLATFRMLKQYEEDYPNLTPYWDRLEDCIKTCERILDTNSLDLFIKRIASYKKLSLQGKASCAKTDEEKAMAKIIANYTDSFSSQFEDETGVGNIVNAYKRFDRAVDKYSNEKHAIRCYKTIVKKWRGILEHCLEDATALPNAEKFVDGVQKCIVTCNAIVTANDVNKVLDIIDGHDSVMLFEDARSFEDEEMHMTAHFIAQNIVDFDNDIRQDVSKSLEYMHYQNGVYIEKLVEIAKRFANVLAQNKLKDNALSFEDLQTNALKLLESGEVATNFATVFVDEYQDVNPTQEAIICKVAKDECFFVGDVKQSIYGFRLADPSLFLDRQDRYNRSLTEGTNITFNRNFRSVRSILKFVNDVFDDAMTMQTADVNYKYNARFELDDIKSTTIDQVPLDGDVQIHLFVKPETVPKMDSGLYDITNDVCGSDDVDSAEGMFIANQIKTLVGRACGDGKRIGYGDIAILFRSRTSGASEILEVLRKQNIPVNDSGFKREEDSAERELMSMLYAIDNPRQDIPFAGYLLSFFGGYSEGELAKIAQVCKANCFYDKFLCKARMNDDDLAIKAQNTLKVLEKYRIKSSFENIAQLMSEIVRDYSYDAYLAKGGNGNVYALNSFIAGAQDSDCSLSKFLQGYKHGNGDSGASAGGDRVVVSTFHGFKGLERPIVFVSDTSTKFSNKSCTGDVILSGKGISSGRSDDNNKGLIGINAYDNKNKFKYKDTLSKRAVSMCLKDNQLKEETRLFYVALTRAQQIMYITATITNNQMKTFAKMPHLTDPSSPLEIIENAIYNESLLKMPVMHIDNSMADEIDNAKLNRVLPTPSEELVNEIKKAQEYVYAHKQATTLAMKYSVTALDSIDDQTVFAYQEHGQDYAKIGTAYHKVMQHIDYYVQGIDGVEKEIERMCSENILSQQEKQVVKPDDIRRCLDSEIMLTARKYALDGKCHREQPFMMYKPASELSSSFESDDKVLVQGVIDLFIDGDEKIIVDFKNSLLSDERAIERYKKQLYLYKIAVESAFCVKIDKMALYSFKTGKTHFIQ